MKLYHLLVDHALHLAVEGKAGIVDLTAAGFPYTMNQIISGIGKEALEAMDISALPAVEAPVFGNVVSPVGKLLCVGLNYTAHAQGMNMALTGYPVLFSKFADALTYDRAPVTLPPWEDSYDYEAELVIVMGKRAWNVSREEAMDYVFGYTCGNDMSLRDAQMRSGQWLIGKTMPGFAPTGPCIVTRDELDPYQGVSVRSYVNGELRQDGTTTDMIYDCAAIISYASRYVLLEPGDLIYTGTPTGVAMEKKKKIWLRPGDEVRIEVGGIGTLTNTMV